MGFILHDIFRNDELFLLAVFDRRKFVHDILQHFFDDAAKSARAGFLADGFVGDFPDRFIGEFEFDVVEGERCLKLLCDRVFRFGEDAHQIVPRKFFECDGDRNPSDQFGDDAEFDKVVRSAAVDNGIG